MDWKAFIALLPLEEVRALHAACASTIDINSPAKRRYTVRAFYGVRGTYSSAKLNAIKEWRRIFAANLADAKANIDAIEHPGGLVLLCDALDAKELQRVGFTLEVQP